MEHAGVLERIMTYKFFPLEENEKQELADKVSSNLPLGYQDLSFCKVFQAEMPFYAGWVCYEIQKEEDVTAKPITFFVKDDKVLILDWQPKTILEFNKEVPLVLSIDDISSYVLFFFSHTRARDGQMKIVTSYDDFRWREEPADTVKRALSSLLRSPYLVSWNEQERVYEVGAHILFQHNLFDCRLMVNRFGEIEITERTLQVEDMPLLDDIAE